MTINQVRPGDLIKAEDWNQLIEKVNAMDTRLGDLENGGANSPPRITSVLPIGTVTAGDTISIVGSNFDFTRGAQRVFFGATRATSFASGSSDSMLVVQIPDQIDGATASGASITMTVWNMTASATWPLTIKSKPQQVGGGIEFGYKDSVPAAPTATAAIQYNFELVSLSNADLAVLITPNLQFAGAPAGLVEVHDADGQLKADRTIALAHTATKIISVTITRIPDVPIGTTFGLTVMASAPGVQSVTEILPTQTIGHAGEEPDSTITNLTFNRILDGSASFVPPSPGDTVAGVLSIPGKAAATVTIALDTTFANIPAGNTFHYIPSANVISGVGWSAEVNLLVTQSRIEVLAPGAQQFPGFDINAPAVATPPGIPAVIQFMLTREEATTNNKRSITFRVQRS